MLGRLKMLDESREEFVSNVSHELKTPMTSMKVLADSLLEMKEAPVEMYQEFMQDIAKEIDRENQIITDLLSLVKMDKTGQNLNIQTVNINELLEQILKRLRPIADKKNVEMVMESFRPVSAEIDEMKFTLAISNLVENAINIIMTTAGSMYLSMQIINIFISKWKILESESRRKTSRIFLSVFTGWTSLIPERSAVQGWGLRSQEMQ